jgi:hypothetical protein
VALAYIYTLQDGDLPSQITLSICPHTALIYTRIHTHICKHIFIYIYIRIRALCFSLCEFVRVYSFCWLWRCRFVGCSSGGRLFCHLLGMLRYKPSDNIPSFRQQKPNKLRQLFSGPSPNNTYVDTHSAFAVPRLSFMSFWQAHGEGLIST